MRSFAVALSLAVILAGLNAPACAEPALSAPADAHEVILRMLARNPGLTSYRTRVHVNVRMLNFPYLSPQLDGTSYFKRPSNFEVIFDRVPSYAKGFSKLFNDIGDPAAWEKDQIVTLIGTRMLDGRPVLVLHLTKKIHSDILDHTLAYVDPATYELVQMEWYYTSGGKITMTQSYHDEDGFSVIYAQHAAISNWHIHAVADSSYQPYETNVPIDDTVFAQR